MSRVRAREVRDAMTKLAIAAVCGVAVLTCPTAGAAGVPDPPPTADPGLFTCVASTFTGDSGTLATLPGAIAPCPEGQVPQPVAQYVPKGPPPPAVLGPPDATTATAHRHTRRRHGRRRRRHGPSPRVGQRARTT